ncbi:MAG: hypothetical protein J6Z50_04620 [Fibrobacterales bacterium]|nr:hypothetical protein [Fibrobacterales bacterium]MBP5188396.1 hypothetical protein [Fibrobacterales bacterium]
METRKKETVSVEIDSGVLAAFREKAKASPTVNSRTGLLATEDELVEALMKFYVNGDIVQI